MKKVLALLSAISIITLAGCERTDLPVMKSSSNPAKESVSSETDADIPPPDNTGIAPPEDSDFLPPSVTSEPQKLLPADDYEYVADIHEWEYGNRLYNGDGTYDFDERYFSEFTDVETPAVLWRNYNENKAALDEIYDADAAVEFAKAHWDDELDLCAPFI